MNKHSTEFGLVPYILLASYVARFRRVFAVLCARKKKVVAATGGAFDPACCDPHFRDQFGHRLDHLSRFQIMEYHETKRAKEEHQNFPREVIAVGLSPTTHLPSVG